MTTLSMQVEEDSMLVSGLVLARQWTGSTGEKVTEMGMDGGGRARGLLSRRADRVME